MQDNNNTTNNSGELPIAALLRMAADGELTEQQQARLDEHLRTTPTDAGCVEFERSLQTACARSFENETITCPDSVRNAVMQAIASDTERAEAPASDDMPVIGRIDETGAAHRGNRMTWARTIANVAASVAIVAIAITLMRFALGPGANTEAIAGFVVKEHSHCVLDDAHAVRKLSMTDLQALPSDLQSMLGQDLWIPDLTDAGYTFLGAGKCGVPGGPSVHMVFEPTDGEGGTAFDGTVSLFVQRHDAAVFEIEPGRTYTFDNHVPDKQALIWETDGLIYYLVADSEAQRNEAAKRICERDEWPDPIQ